MELPALPREPLPPELPESCPPQDGKPWGFWMTLLFAFSLGIIIIVIANVISIPFFIPLLQENGNDTQAAQKQLGYNGLFIGLNALITLPLVIGGCYLFARFRRNRGITVREYLALKCPGWKEFLIWPVIWYVSMEGAGWLLIKAGAPEVNPWMKEMAENLRYFPAVLFAVVISAPLMEEFIFRGFVFEGWQKSMNWMPPTAAVIVTILLTNCIWTVIHGQYDVFGLAAVFSLGLLLSIARVISKSIWIPVYLHFIHNAFASFGMWEMMKAGNAGG